MRQEIYSSDGLKFIETRQAKPGHGDFCNRCEECLACCGRQRCATAKRENDPPYRHQWITYVNGQHEED